MISILPPEELILEVTSKSKVLGKTDWTNVIRLIPGEKILYTKFEEVAKAQESKHVNQAENNNVIRFPKPKRLVAY